ncbi:MAG: RNA-guided endonuclease IscB [Caldiserica bacterium]|nr:RNA-guided endonuclease IscB [Caldisericota bacterium]
MIKQKLSRRNTYTPMVIPQDRSNCGLSLNREETLSVAGLKTLDNNPDAALTPKGGQNLRVSDKVYVLNMRGKPLMPCSPQKARVLLKQGKAKVVNRTPFVIQLLIATGETKQSIILGVDSGYSNIGLSAVTNKQEVYSAEVNLRNDIVKLNSERRQYRSACRNRKTWYRKPRFLNRKKPEGWLAPSIQNKLDAHIKVINHIKHILPVTQINVEVASFDIQKIKNPDIKGTDYQNGKQKGFWNVREYALYRDNHTCQYCKGKSKDPILEIHHIIPQSQCGTDKPDNLITLCETCHKHIHDNHLEGEIAKKFKLGNEFKVETFMSMVRWMLINKLKELGNDTYHTYGYITKSSRIGASLPKSHINDAFIIAYGSKQERNNTQYFIRQIRKCNRSLFKANLVKEGKRKVNTIREAFGFHRFDKVLYKGTECFIHGLRTAGYFDLRKLDGTKIHASAKYSQIFLLESAKTFLIERRHTAFIPTINGVVSKP